MGLVLVHKEVFMDISKTLIYENRLRYVKAIIIKLILALAIAKLFTYQGTFLGTAFLSYFTFSLLYFSFRISKNYLVATIIFLGICIGIFLANEYLQKDFSVETSNSFFVIFILFPFLYDLFITLWVTIKKIHK